jgi:hypothetical protein
MRIHRNLLCLAVATALLTGGCAKTATISQWKPAEIDVGHVRRLVVVPVAGPEDLAAEAESILISNLAGSGRFEVLQLDDLPPLPGVSPQGPDGRLNRSAAIELARTAGADAVLLASLARRCEGGTDMGGITVRFGEPTTQVAMRFELIDARSGEKIASDQTIESYVGELGGDVQGRYVEHRVMQEMVTKNATQVAAKLAPHKIPTAVELAGDSWFGSAEVRAGCTLAKAGRWEDAAKVWRMVLDADPNNHAAQYNLGLAYEAQQDLAMSQQMYQAALALSDEDTYRAAADRVASSLEDQRVILAQAQPKPPTTQLAAEGNALRRLPPIPSWPVPVGFTVPHTATHTQPAPFGPY